MVMPHFTVYTILLRLSFAGSDIVVASARPGISDEMAETRAILFPSINFKIFEGSGVEDATKDWRDVETVGPA